MDDSTCDAINFLRNTISHREEIFNFIRRLSVDDKVDINTRKRLALFLLKTNGKITLDDRKLYEWCKNMMVEAEIIKGIL